MVEHVNQEIQNVFVVLDMLENTVNVRTLLLFIFLIVFASTDLRMAFDGIWVPGWVSTFTDHPE